MASSTDKARWLGSNTPAAAGRVEITMPRDGALLTIDRPQVKKFLTRLQKVAGDRAGSFVINGFGEEPRTNETLPAITHVVANGPDAVHHMVEAVEKITATRGYNA